MLLKSVSAIENIAFLSSYRNTSGNLGQRKLLWKQKPD